MDTKKSFENGNVGRKLGMKEDSDCCMMIFPANLMAIGLQKEKGSADMIIVSTKDRRKSATLKI